MNKLKKIVIFLIKSIVVQAVKDYLTEMNQGKDPLELKTTLQRLVCDVQLEKTEK